jgi:hypothetical protein
VLALTFGAERGSTHDYLTDDENDAVPEFDVERVGTPE